MRDTVYPKYENSGVEWLGDVPVHWETCKFKHIAQLYGRIGFRGYTTDDLVDEGEGAITLSPSNMRDGELNLEKSTFISWEKYYESPEIMIKPEDIVVVKTGSTFGKISYVRNVEHPITLNPQLAVFKKIKCNNRFFFFYVGTPLIQDQISLSNTGSTIPTITQQTIMSYSIPLPPLLEQKTITSFLDRETGRIDALINRKQRLLVLLAEQRTALISHTVTKGLDVTVKMKPSGVEWLGEVPAHWGNLSLKWASVRYSGGTPDKTIQDYWEEGTIPWLNSGAVNDGYIIEPSTYITKEAFQNSSAKWIPKGALVMALAGQGKTKGMVAQLGFRTTCNQSMAAIVPDDRINSRMLYWWLTRNYVNIRNLGGGEARDGLNLDMLGSIPVPLPPLHEQQTIAAFLDSETAKIDALSRKIETVIERLKEYRVALISSVVTGKIDVRGEV